MPYRKWKGREGEETKREKERNYTVMEVVGSHSLGPGHPHRPSPTGRWNKQVTVKCNIPLGRGTRGAVSHPSLRPLNPVLTASSGLDRGQRVWITKQSLSEWVCRASLSESHLSLARWFDKLSELRGISFWKANFPLTGRTPPFLSLVSASREIPPPQKPEINPNKENKSESYREGHNIP